jgi:hypothetical protein
MPLFSPRRFSVLLLAAALACGGDLTLPNPTGPGVKLDVVGGNGQTGTVGEELPVPLVVAVVTSEGLPIAGRRVAFVPASAGVDGHLDPDTAVTNSEGQALSRWVLSTVPGDHAAEARLVVADSATPPIALFQASARPAPPDTIQPAGPVNQPGRRNEELAEPLVVRVADRYGNPVDGVVVNWQVESGDGELIGADAPTGVDGTVSVRWKLGDRNFVQRVTASIDGANGSPVIFQAFVLF